MQTITIYNNIVQKNTLKNYKISAVKSLTTMFLQEFKGLTILRT